MILISEEEARSALVWLILASGDVITNVVLVRLVFNALERSGVKLGSVLSTPRMSSV